MIDTTVFIAPAADLVALDLWAGDPPDLAITRAFRVEPSHWWLVDAGEGLAAIATALGDRGALTAFGGGFVRATITGPGWRELLSVSSLIDTDEAAMPLGSFTSTVIHHVPVRIAVAGTDRCELFFAASYASTLSQLWQGATSGE